MMKNVFRLFLFGCISGAVISCNSSEKKTAPDDFAASAKAEIETLKKSFPAGTDWEMLPGDSANSFILAAEDSFMLCANLADDSAKMKFKVSYVIRPQLNEKDSLAMRKLQDSVTQASLALVDKIVAATDPKEKAKYDAEDKKLSEISPLMPAFSNGKFSVYRYEPDHHFCHEEKLDAEYELLNEAVKNYFMTGKFTFEDLLKVRVQEDLKLKQVQ